MSFNAFTDVKLSADGKTLFVDGHSDPHFKATKIDVAIISASDEEKRIQASVTAPIGSSWHAKLKQADLPEGKPPFADGESVYIAGAASSETQGLFLWGGVPAGHGELDVTGTVVQKSEA